MKRLLCTLALMTIFIGPAMHSVGYVDHYANAYKQISSSFMA